MVPEKIIGEFMFAGIITRLTRGVDEAVVQMNDPDLYTAVVVTAMFLVGIAALIVTLIRGRTRKRILKGGDVRKTRRSVRRAA
jgi:hypothetical protein